MTGKCQHVLGQYILNREPPKLLSNVSTVFQFQCYHPIPRIIITYNNPSVVPYFLLYSTHISPMLFPTFPWICPNFNSLWLCLYYPFCSKDLASWCPHGLPHLSIRSYLMTVVFLGYLGYGTQTLYIIPLFYFNSGFHHYLKLSFPFIYLVACIISLSAPTKV